MKRRRNDLVAMGLACLLCAAIGACDRAEMERMHEQNVEKWNEFWKSGDSALSASGHKSGDTEMWTIECNEYLGPRSQEMADGLASALKRVEKLKPQAVRVEHGESRSRVLYGSYALKYARARVTNNSQVQGDAVIELSEEIKNDLKFIRTLAMGEQYPFFSARPIPQPEEDVGPPEWDLRNAKGVYSLNVGVTYNTPTMHNYKEAAVEWVKALRDQGSEAYYYHAPDAARSSICVGTFGEDALVIGPDGKSQYSEAVEALRNQSDFQYNLENGARVFNKTQDPDTGKVERIPYRSFLVKIPKKEGGRGIANGGGVKP
jgi:hypothetical protein